MKFEDTIREIRAQRPQVYKVFTLDLTAARSDYELPIVGNYFNVIDATDLNVNIQVRFNEQSADEITLKKRQGVKIPFYRLYITNAAQAAKTITIAYGISETPFEMIDQSSVFEVSSITNPVDISDRSSRRVGKVVKLGVSLGRASNGVLVSPAVGTILADTGPLPIGNYNIKVIHGGSGSSGIFHSTLRHRNADNTATIFSYPSGGPNITRVDFEVYVAANERFRDEVTLLDNGNQHSVIVYQRLDS